MASREFSGSGRNIAMARDTMLALTVGFMTGALSIPVVINLGIALPIPDLCLPLVVAALFAIAILAAGLVAGRFLSLLEFTKFAVVGVLNSGVDFGLLNSLILVTGVVSGAGFLAFKSISVTVAVVNSYFWNKFWTFEAAKSAGTRRELSAFLVVTLLAVGLNVVGAHVIVNVIGAPRGISTRLWANIGAISGAGLTLFTNFFGYKFYVFRKPLLVAEEL